MQGTSHELPGDRVREPPPGQADAERLEAVRRRARGRAAAGDDVAGRGLGGLGRRRRDADTDRRPRDRASARSRCHAVRSTRTTTGSRTARSGRSCTASSSGRPSTAPGGTPTGVVNERFAAADDAGVPGFRWVHDYHLLLLPELLRRTVVHRAGSASSSTCPFRLPRCSRGCRGGQPFSRACSAPTSSRSTRRATATTSSARARSASTTSRWTGRRSGSTDGRVGANDRAPDLDRRRGPRATRATARPSSGRSPGSTSSSAAAGCCSGSTGSTTRRAFRSACGRSSSFSSCGPISAARSRSSRWRCRAGERSASTGSFARRSSSSSAASTGASPSRDSTCPCTTSTAGVTPDRLLAYYRAAEVCLVTPLQDGMNLVAKEYVTVQAATEGTGVLVLSEFAGAIEELPEALSCNPFDLEGLAGHDQPRTRARRGRPAAATAANGGDGPPPRRLRLARPGARSARRSASRVDGSLGVRPLKRVAGGRSSLPPAVWCRSTPGSGGRRRRPGAELRP